MVDPARRRAHIRCDIFEKRDYIVISPLLNLVDLIDLEFSFLANDGGVFLRNQTKPRHRVTGDGFNLEPDFEFALVRPDSTHFRPGITGDHQCTIRVPLKPEKRFSCPSRTGLFGQHGNASVLCRTGACLVRRRPFTGHDSACRIRESASFRY